MISFRANDGHGSHSLSNVVSRNITVNPNATPVAADDSASTDNQTAIVIPVLANDADPDGDSGSIIAQDRARRFERLAPVGRATHGEVAALRTTCTGPHDVNVAF